MPARAAERLRPERGANGQAPGTEDVMARCTELEGELAELRALYESYFMGNERIPPLKQHDAFRKAYLKVKGSSVRQTAVKFRLESIGQKLLTFERLWDRTLKEIEAGTYKRDLARLRRHQKGQGKRKEEGDFQIDEDLDLSDLDVDDGGEDDLAAAMAAAEAAAEARAKAAPPAPPPMVAPLVPSVAPVAARTTSGSIPAITPAGGKPATGMAPVLTPAARTTSGSIPVITPAGGKPATGMAPVLTPAARTTSGSIPVITPAGGKPATGMAPVLTPAGGKPATGMAPALTPAGPRPAGATGAHAAFKPAASPPVRPTSATGDGGLSDQKVKAIYDAYLMAKKRCGEDTRSVTLDSVASSLRQQVPELMKSHNVKSVEFKVVIKDGKAVLRALPKE